MSHARRPYCRIVHRHRHLVGPFEAPARSTAPCASPQDLSLESNGQRRSHGMCPPGPCPRPAAPLNIRAWMCPAPLARRWSCRSPWSCGAIRTRSSDGLRAWHGRSGSNARSSASSARQPIRPASWGTIRSRSAADAPRRVRPGLRGLRPRSRTGSCATFRRAVACAWPDLPADDRIPSWRRRSIRRSAATNRHGPGSLHCRACIE